MTNLEIALEATRGQMHYAQAHLGLFEEIIKEFDELRGLILAYKARIDPLIEEYEAHQKLRDALISPNHDPVELMPVPSALEEDFMPPIPTPTYIPSLVPQVDLTAPTEIPPVDEHVDTTPTPTETAPVAEVEPPAAVPELKSIPDLLATSPDPVTAAPTTAE